MRSILIAEAIFILMGGNIIAETPSVEWIKPFGRGYLDAGNSVQQTTDKGYIVTGETDGDYFLIKTDSLENLMWQKTFGGEGLEIAYSVQQTMDKGYIVGGMSDTGGIYIIKTDSSGQLQWQKTYGGDYGDEEHYISAQQTDDGGYIIAGDPNYLIKIDSLGNIQWRKTPEYCKPTALQTLDKGYIMGGCGSNSLVKTDSLGNLQWDKTLDSSKFIAAKYVQITSDKGYVVIGSINIGKADTVEDGIYMDARNDDIYLVKTDSLGNVQWDWTYHQPFIDKGISVWQTADGGYIALGNINGKMYLIKIRVK